MADDLYIHTVTGELIFVGPTFRDLITGQMAKRKLSRNTFAKLVGVSKTMVSHWVNPDRPMREAPDVATIRKLCEALDLTEWDVWLAVGRQLGLSVHAAPDQPTVIISGEPAPGQVDEIRGKVERALDDGPAPIDGE